MTITNTERLRWARYLGKKHPLCFLTVVAMYDRVDSPLCRRSKDDMGLVYVAGVFTRSYLHVLI